MEALAKVSRLEVQRKGQREGDWGCGGESRPHVHAHKHTKESSRPCCEEGVSKTSRRSVPVLAKRHTSIALFRFRSGSQGSAIHLTATDISTHMTNKLLTLQMHETTAAIKLLMASVRILGFFNQAPRRSGIAKIRLKYRSMNMSSAAALKAKDPAVSVRISSGCSGRETHLHGGPVDTRKSGLIGGCDRCSWPIRTYIELS